MNCGDVCLARFPFTDASATKLRPVLIVSGSRHNKGSDVVAVPISSQPAQNDRYSVFVDSLEASQAGLRCPSAVKWSKPTTIDRRVIIRRLGELPNSILNDVLAKLRSMFGDVT